MDFDRDGDFDVDDYWAFWTGIYAKQPGVNLSDVNFDGEVDDADADAWRDAYERGIPNADTNADGELSSADAEAFGRAWLLTPR